MGFPLVRPAGRGHSLAGLRVANPPHLQNDLLQLPCLGTSNETDELFQFLKDPPSRGFPQGGDRPGDVRTAENLNVAKAPTSGEGLLSDTGLDSALMHDIPRTFAAGVHQISTDESTLIPLRSTST